MLTLKDILIDSNKQESYPDISLAKMLNTAVVDISLGFTQEYGYTLLTVRNIILADGTYVGVNGEHDMVYIEDYKGRPEFEEENLDRLNAEWEAETEAYYASRRLNVDA